MSKTPIGEILIELGKITRKQLMDALEYQKGKNLRLGKALLELKFISPDDIFMALAKQYNYPFVNLNELNIAQDVVELVSSDAAYQYQVVPLNYDVDNNRLNLAIAPPFELNLMGKLEQVFQKKVKFALASPLQLEACLKAHYPKAE